MCLQSAGFQIKVRLATSRKRDGNGHAWVVNAARLAAAVWDERTCEVAGEGLRSFVQAADKAASTRT